MARCSRTAVLRAADVFRVLGDAPRLYTLELLLEGEICVSTLAAHLGDSLPAVSQRLKLFRAAGLVTRRRVGRHVFYRLADDHVRDLLSNALAHAAEFSNQKDLPAAGRAAFPRENAHIPRNPASTVLS